MRLLVRQDYVLTYLNRKNKKCRKRCSPIAPNKCLNGLESRDQLHAKSVFLREVIQNRYNVQLGASWKGGLSCEGRIIKVESPAELESKDCQDDYSLTCGLSIESSFKTNIEKKNLFQGQYIMYWRVNFRVRYSLKNLCVVFFPSVNERKTLFSMK
jgi:hypothetical protein